MRNGRRIVVAALIAAHVMSLTATTTARASAPASLVEPSALVSQPTVEGPIPVPLGIRTGYPYRKSLVPMKAGWLEEEFFISGTARSAPTGTATTAAYKTRILVRRPSNPDEFNGTVMIDWTNVTVPDDTDVSWLPMHKTIMERGFVYVAVAAQLLAVEASPLALKQWDPVRYGSLNHPSDTYSFDIFSQAAEAVLNPIVLDDLRPLVARRLAFGASQSGGRLHTYINSWEPHYGLFDGYQPQVSGSGGVNRTLKPILWFNSSSEAGGSTVPADSDLFRLWEIAGPAHTTNEYSTYENGVYIYSHSNGLSGDAYDEEAQSGWGYQHVPGSCNYRNYYNLGPVASASLVALDNWVRTGVAPAGARAARANGARLHDEHGNVLGGVRSPLVDVPVAAYYGGAASLPTPCSQVGGRLPLTGTTEMFSAEKLAALYPTEQAYKDAFRAAVADAMANGWMLQEHADDMIRRLELHGLPNMPA